MSYGLPQTLLYFCLPTNNHTKPEMFMAKSHRSYSRREHIRRKAINLLRRLHIYDLNDEGG